MHAEGDELDHVQRATDIRVHSREWRGLPRRLTSGFSKTGFRRALDCRKRFAAQLATCSVALGTWLARAAIVGGAFMLRVPRGACSEKETRDLT